MTQTELDREERRVVEGEQAASGGRSVPNGQGIASVATANVLAVMEVDPEDLLIDEDLKALRNWTGSAKHELSIPALAQMIYEEGQDSPCLVRPTEDGLMIVAGHRRQEAALLIRKEQDPEWMLKVIVEELSDDQALRKALSENIQREDFTRVERGRIHQLIRKRFGWNGKEGTARVAEFVGLSPSTVTQDEKLVGASKDILDKVLSDRMTVTAALDLLVGKPEKQGEVAARAIEIAEEKEAKKASGKKGKGNGTPACVDQPSLPANSNRSEPTAEKDLGSGARSEDRGDTQEPGGDTQDSRRGRGSDGPGSAETSDTKTDHQPSRRAPKVESSHVRQAQREVPGALDKPRSMKMTEAIGLMEQWTGPAYPKVMGRFASAFVDRAHGKLKGGDKELEAAWDDIADALSPTRRRTSLMTEQRLGKVPKVNKPAKKATAPKAKKVTKPVKKVVAKNAKPKVEAKPKSKAAAKKPAKPPVKAAKVKAKGQTEKLAGGFAAMVK